MENFKVQFYSWKVVRLVGKLAFWITGFIASRIGYSKLSMLINIYLRDTGTSGERLVNEIQERYFAVFGVILFFLFSLKLGRWFINRSLDFYNEFKVAKALLELWILVGLLALVLSGNAGVVPTSIYIYGTLGYIIAVIARNQDKKNMLKLFLPVIHKVHDGEYLKEYKGFNVVEIEETKTTMRDGTIETQVNLLLSSKLNKKYKVSGILSPDGEVD